MGAERGVLVGECVRSSVRLGRAIRCKVLCLSPSGGPSFPPSLSTPFPPAPPHSFSPQVWRDNSCPHCHEVAPAWEEAAKELKGVVHFGRINYDRNQVLLQFRLRQLPTIFAVTGQGEVRLMTARNGYTADEIIKFASNIVVSSSTGQRIDARGSAQRLLNRPAHADKVHVILFDRSDWAAFHSAAMAPALRDWMVFAVFPRPSLSDSISQQYGIKPEDRTVVVVREDGSFEKKTGIRSRKVLVRFLLQNQYQLVPKVTAHNWAQICLGVGGSSQGLHTMSTCCLRGGPTILCASWLCTTPPMTRSGRSWR